MDEEHIGITRDRVALLVESALGQARVAHAAILAWVEPELPPARRLGAGRVMKLIESGRLFRSEVLDEIDALNTQIAGEVAAGSRQAFRPHDSDPSHGHVETVHDRRAMLLSRAGYQLRLLYMAITTVLDAVEAERLTAKLYSD
ncbi:hypothetical protein SAMN04490244_1187 [Tranquillimonas rosea]|uniref:Uncharacterized protein n=1 Tax=Tranquillimonas rosea TaxID=641238 RepID=A0A1H9X4I4_9RHOB|nr:hypothetical protein [Tranquillimonas rosea]SES41034.1 hypothetical protein SAMN04490244_1187 [Tranquillimonas rosea]